MSGQWSLVRLTTEERPSRGIAVAILVVYAALTLYVGLHHEPWRDEADSWLVVRDASVGTLLTWTRNAGTPALWYFALEPLVRSGLPFSSQEILHLVLAWCAAAIFLLYAPMPWPVKILVLASYYFGYEYAVIARSYVLTAGLSFAAAAWHAGRHLRPVRYAILLALLFNTNVHGALIAAILVLLFVIPVRTRRISVAALAVMIAGAAAAWLQLRTAPDAAFPHVVRQIQPDVAGIAIANALLPGVAIGAATVIAIAVLALIAIALRTRTEALLFLITSISFLTILYVFVWFGGYRHAGLILLCVVLAIWIAREVPVNVWTAGASIALNATLFASALFCVRMATADVLMAFSGAEEIGTFIRTHSLDRNEIAAHNIHETEAVLPWIPGKRLWYAAIGRYGTYMRWNREEEIGRHVPYSEAVRRAVEHFAPMNRPWLLLLNTAMPAPESHGFRLVAQTHGMVYRHPDERYWLYQWIGTPTR